MRLFVFADYESGYEILKFLSKTDDIVGLATVRPEYEMHLNKGYPDKIRKLVDINNNYIFYSDEVHNNIDIVKSLEPDYILCLNGAILLKPELISVPKYGCINLHLAYLPYNRGPNPNVWSIVEETPIGVTIHYINDKIDNGPIIAQRLVNKESIDTGKTLWYKLSNVAIELYKETWPKIKNNSINPTKQEHNNATMHYRNDLSKLDEIKLDDMYKAKYLINLIRARTFRPFPSAYFIDSEGKKVYVRIDLEYEK